MNSVRAIYDMDIGSDPDDTCVAAMIALEPKRFNPALIITSDESVSQGRAKFLSALIGSVNCSIPIASGLPSERKIKDTLVERANLTSGCNYIEDGISALYDLISAESRINYFVLGAFTNLAKLLSSNPSLANRINLIGMGPALIGAYRTEEPQYNIRIDVPSFFSVTKHIRNPTFLMSHTSWKSFGSGRKELGIYADDPFYNALKKSNNPVHKLLTEHLCAWYETGKPCSVMHDPLTVLSAKQPIVDFCETELLLHTDGRAEISNRLRNEMNLNAARYINIANARQTHPKDCLKFPVRMSLSADYNEARRMITSSLQIDSEGSIASQWHYHNSKMKE